jgi:hypothetical protein
VSDNSDHTPIINSAWLASDLGELIDAMTGGPLGIDLTRSQPVIRNVGIYREGRQRAAVGCWHGMDASA